MSTELKSEGISITVVNVKAEDMFMSQGNLGLLSCVLWCTSGSVLLNETLITKQNAYKLLYQANKFKYNSYHLILIKPRWFKKNFKLGLLGSSRSIGHLLSNKLANFQNKNLITDILKMIESNCSRHDKFFI